MPKKPTYEELEQRIQELEQAESELKTTEKALRESEERFRTAFENAAAGMALMANDGYFMSVNQTLCKILGYSEEELLSKTWVEITDPDDLDGCFDWLKRIKAGDGSTYEKRFIHKLGHQVWVMVSSSPVRDSQGKIRYYISLFQDVMLRKQAEAALLESEERYRSLFDNMINGVAIYRAENDGEDFVLVDFNKSGERIDKIEKEDLVGQSVQKMYPGVKDFGLFDVFKRVWKTGKSENHPEALYKDQRISGWRANSVYKLPSGEIVTVFSDETEHKQSEEALFEAYNIINRSPAVVFLWINAEGWPVQFVSDNVKEVFGYTAKEFTSGKVSYATTIHPDDLQRVAQEVTSYGGEEGREDFVHKPYRIFTKDGETKWLNDMKIIRRNVKGDITHYQGIVLDITKCKQAEEALKISRENLLEESNQRKILSKRLIDLLEKDRHYIAMELHDNIGQILTSLKINLEIIDDKLKPADTELGFLIKTAKKRAKQAIDDLNNIAQGLMPGILDALGLVSSLRTLLDEFREHTDIKIKFFNRNVPKRFDQEKEIAIYRIVQEALNNIVKHAKAKNVYMSLLKKGNVLFLSVEDDGVGFDQDKAMKISKRKGPLGLIIMQERAMQLDGELTIESKMGKGTHLLAEIPI
ncbi:MAG: PAS domain S-box protein [Desulfobacterales bacterium]